MSELALNNGATVVSVEDMTGEQIDLAMQHVEHGDDDLREDTTRLCLGDDRAYVAAYAAEHKRRFGSVWTLP